MDGITPQMTDGLRSTSSIFKLQRDPPSPERATSLTDCILLCLQGLYIRSTGWGAGTAI